MSNPLERYQNLGLKDSFSRIHQYPLSCKELSFILKTAYAKFPKNLQALVFQDILTAFRFLPGMQTRNAVSSAHNLLHSAEATLPKQKRNLAVTEFKHAMVAHKRRCKTRQEEVKDSAQLPQDVLVHVFSFLDMQSLASVGQVCWSWNLAATDNHLWKLQYDTFFGNYSSGLKINGSRSNKVVKGDKSTLLLEETATETSIDWREAFKRARIGIQGQSSKLTSTRGYCRYCYTIVWLDNMRCSNVHIGQDSEFQRINPLSLDQVVEYILDESLTSSSDSDSDSDGESIFRLWAYPFRNKT